MTEARAAQSPGVDLLAHAAIFTLINALLWVQDFIITGGINYVLWVTLPWAVGLTAHAVAYLVGRRE
ncbi:MAG: 2TM domain-containing protein [Actinomycetota bacterium]